MSATFDERVLDYVTGAMEESELVAFEAEMGRSAVLRLMVQEAEELLVASTEALAPVAPTPALRLRVLEAVVPPTWSRLLDRVAQVWDLTVEQVRATFARAMDPAEWEDGPLPGTRVFHLEGGPATAGADVGLVCFAAGLRFPVHTHGESETYVVLSGEILDSSGRVEQEGDTLVNPNGMVHSFVVADDAPCYFALVLRGGLQILGPPP